MNIQRMVEFVKMGQRPDIVFARGLTEAISSKVTAVPGVFDTSRGLPSPSDSSSVVSSFARGADVAAAKRKKPSKPMFRDAFSKKGRYLKEAQMGGRIGATLAGASHGAISGGVPGAVIGAGYHGVRKLLGKDKNLSKEQRKSLLKKRVAIGAAAGSGILGTRGAASGYKFGRILDKGFDLGKSISKS